MFLSLLQREFCRKFVICVMCFRAFICPKVICFTMYLFSIRHVPAFENTCWMILIYFFFFFAGYVVSIFSQCVSVL